MYLRNLLCAIACMCSFGPGSTALADNIFHVGYQADCSEQPDVGSFFHGDIWYGYFVPGLDDSAIFDEAFDPQGNGHAPHWLHFGTFCLHNQCGQQEFAAQTAEVGALRFDSGLWTLDFDAGGYFCNPSNANTGGLTTGGMGVARGANTLAEVTVMGAGRLLTDSVVVGLDAGRGTLHLTSGGIIEVLNGLNVGGGGGPSVGVLEISGVNSILVHRPPIHDDMSIGHLQENVGTLVVRDKALLRGGNGHLFLGREGGEGHLSILDGGRVELAPDWVAAVGAGLGGTSTALVSGRHSSWTIGGTLEVGPNDGENGEITVSHAGSISARSVVIARGGRGSVTARSPARFVCDSMRIASDESSGVGTLTVSGTKGRVEVVKGSLDVGAAGSGTVLCEDRARLTAEVIMLRSKGELRGNGRVAAFVVNEGVISPGNPIGVLTVEGNYQQSLGSLLQIDLGGRQAGRDYDVLQVAGEVDLVGGVVEIDFAEGFSARHGDQFNVVVASSVDGTFEEVRGDAGEGLKWLAEYSAEGITITAVSPVNCGVIQELRVKCRNGRLTAWVFSSLPQGSMLLLDNDGDRKSIVVGNDGISKAVWKDQAGSHLVKVVECHDFEQLVDCQ